MSDQKDPPLDPDAEDDLLDEGLEESFPASDPPALSQPHPQEDRPGKGRKD